MNLAKNSLEATTKCDKINLYKKLVTAKNIKTQAK